MVSRSTTPTTHEEPGPEKKARDFRLERPFLLLGLAGTLVLLLAHARLYFFLCDDAFISFRYARNLAHGNGLVFNRGLEAVEGYTNFFWTILLAGASRLGLSLEVFAPALSMLATVGLWSLVVIWSWRRNPTDRRWLLLLAPLFLAATRSVAVWSSSGLETRWFEMLLVAGVLRLILETEALTAARPLRLSLASVLLGLATLTRPDGLLLSLCAYVASGLWLAARRRTELRRFALGALPYIGLVGAHLLFRRLYYGDWLPNTYYAKVGGRLWWDSGGNYLAAFCLEYAVWLWVPLLVAAVLQHRKSGTLLVPIVFGAVVLPHALYVAAAGGDHFEYRPLDLYFPFAFLMMAEGARFVARTRRGVMALIPFLAIVLVGLVELPWQSHRQFPGDYQPGFPSGLGSPYPEAVAYLSPERNLFYRAPGLREIAAQHRRLLGSNSSRFVGLRQEEHKLFLATAQSAAARLRRLIDGGRLPPDIRIAIDCVGAIPYDTDLPTLDRLGLTDRKVAHSPFVNPDLMAHGKYATYEYAREWKVDLWCVDPFNLVQPLTWPPLVKLILEAMTNPLEPPCLAYLGNNEVLVAYLPQGLADAGRRMGSFQFVSMADSSFMAGFIPRAIEANRTQLRENSGDSEARLCLAILYSLNDREDLALPLYARLSDENPGNADGWFQLGVCRRNLGDRPGAMVAYQRAFKLVEAMGDSTRANAIGAQIESYRLEAVDDH